MEEHDRINLGLIVAGRKLEKTLGIEGKVTVRKICGVYGVSTKTGYECAEAVEVLLNDKFHCSDKKDETDFQQQQEFTRTDKATRC